MNSVPSVCSCSKEEHHTKVKPPELCLNCHQAHVLEGLAYYRRYITTATVAALFILVRRFWCRHCHITISCLPSFAQPYRAVNTPTVAAGFNGQTTPSVQRWQSAIRAYWHRYERHLPALLQRVGSAFGPLPLPPTARDFWQRLLRQCGNLGQGTADLIGQFRTCLFAHYRCHQPRLPAH